MIEILKELEQEAMDNLTPEEYEAISSVVLDDYKRALYQAGYIDGLQTAIRTLSGDDTTMSYTMEIDEMFGEDYARMDGDEE